MGLLVASALNFEAALEALESTDPALHLFLHVYRGNPHPNPDPDPNHDPNPSPNPDPNPNPNPNPSPSPDPNPDLTLVLVLTLTLAPYPNQAPSRARYMRRCTRRPCRCSARSPKG